MSLTKVSYSMIAGAFANVVDFGASTTATAAANTVAFQAAIDSGLGTVLVPAGTFLVNGTINVGTTIICGSGKNTIISSSATGDTFRVGATVLSGGISTGGGIVNLTITITSTTGVAIRLLQTSNAIVENVNVDAADVARPHTAIGVMLDGGNISGYFNCIKNVNCVGVDKGYVLTATGTGELTSSTFVDCSALTYTDNTNGFGYEFTGINGADSIIVGGNLEACKKGIKMASGTWSTNRTQGTSWFGQRFEACSICDIDWGSGGFANSFFGYNNRGNSSVPGWTYQLNWDNTRKNMFVSSASITGVPVVYDTGSNNGLTNIAFGNESIFAVSNGTRADNSYFGYDCGTSVTSGISNTAMGTRALKYATTQSNNSAFGTGALGGVSFTGIENTAIGSGAGTSVTTGLANTLIGTGAGLDLTTGLNNLAIGWNAGTTANALLALTTQDNRIIIGDKSATNAYVNVAWTIVSDARDKADFEEINYGLDFIGKLQPYKFKRNDRSRYKIDDLEGSKKDSKYSIGFKAQDIIEAEKECGATDASLLIADNEDADNLKITETRLIPILVNAINELKAEFETYKLSHP